MLDPNSSQPREHAKPEGHDDPKHKRRQGARRHPEPNSTTDQHAFRTELQRNKSYDLIQPTEDDWREQPAEILERNYLQAQTYYFDIVDDYLEQANRATELFKSHLKSHARWRFWIIFVTGPHGVVRLEC